MKSEPAPRKKDVNKAKTRRQESPKRMKKAPSSEARKQSGYHDGSASNKEARDNTPKGDDNKRWDQKIERAGKSVQQNCIPETNKKKEGIREEYVKTDSELSLGMPRHLTNHGELETNYPREERREREDTWNVMEYETVSRVESGAYTVGDTNGK